MHVWCCQQAGRLAISCKGSKKWYCIVLYWYPLSIPHLNKQLSYGCPMNTPHHTANLWMFHEKNLTLWHSCPMEVPLTPLAIQLSYCCPWTTLILQHSCSMDGPWTPLTIQLPCGCPMNTPHLTTQLFHGCPMNTPHHTAVLWTSHEHSSRYTIQLSYGCPMNTPHLTTQLRSPLSTGQKLDASHNFLFHVKGHPLVTQCPPHLCCALHLPFKVVEGQ